MDVTDVWIVDCGGQRWLEREGADDKAGVRATLDPLGRTWLEETIEYRRAEGGQRLPFYPDSSSPHVKPLHLSSANLLAYIQSLKQQCP